MKRLIRNLKMLISRIRARKKLKRIEKAMEIRLTKRQREAVLSPVCPDLSNWGRAGGKTTTAIIWTLLWRKQPIYLAIERGKVDNCHGLFKEQLESMYGKRAVPDPDGYETYNIFNFMIQRLMQAKVQCTQHGIETCDIFYGGGPGKYEKGKAENSNRRAESKTGRGRSCDPDPEQKHEEGNRHNQG